MANMDLSKLLGDPLGPNPTLDERMRLSALAPGPNGPMPSMEEIQAYLSKAGQIYPPLFPVNQQAWDGMVASWPMSRNIEDRR